MCVISVNMKTATTREVQHHFSKVLDWVDAGEEVVITRRGKKVARVIALEKEIDPLEKEVDWAEAIRERNEALHNLPQLQRNIVLEMREEERY